MRAKLKSGQVVDVKVLREKEGFFGKKFLCEYTTRHMKGEALMYETQNAQWVAERNLFEDQ